MAEKKVKIDLKARLGRPSKGAGSDSATPGVVPPPAGIAPPPGIVSPGGIPAPPFAAQPPKPTGPRIKQGEPFQAVSAEDAAPRPQEIKVEIGHDVVQARKAGFLKIVVAAVLSAVLGVGIGWAVGSMKTRAGFDIQAIEGAQLLATDVEGAHTSIQKLNDVVAAATKTLFKDKKFPENFAKELSGIEIAFSGANLAGKNTNRLKPAVLRMLFDFARDAQELDNRRDALRRLFDARKDQIVELLEQGKNPQISYSLFVGKDKNSNPVGTFVKVAKPYRFDEKSWPDKIGLNTGNEVIEAERYKSGEPFTKLPRREGEKPTVYAIPIEPDGLSKAFPPQLSQRIEEEIKAISSLITGTTPGTVRPDDEKAGLLKIAEDLVRELKAIGAAH